MNIFKSIIKSIKNKSSKVEIPTDYAGLITIFKNGCVVDSVPRLTDYYNERAKINSARYIISDGIKYDLENSDSIKLLPIPDFSRMKYTELPGEYPLEQLSCLDYVLRMKASELRRNKFNELSIIVLKKATEMMPHSPIGWSEKDYMRLTNWLYEDGRFDEADEYKNEVCKVFKKNYKIEWQNRDINNAKELGHDLVISHSSNDCCSECAKYRNRIYSISGNDKRFPRLPNYNCDCSGLHYFIFVENVSDTYFPTNDYVAYSNRPYIDDRTDKEKMLYQHLLDRKVYEELNEKSRRNYQIIKQFLPDIAPKSLSAYTRMRNNYSIQFQQLAEKAKEIGIDISLSENERTILQRYLKNKKEFGS